MGFMEAASKQLASSSTPEVFPMATQKQNPKRGNLIGFLNTKKSPGDSRPIFQGKITLPGQEAERGYALWSYTSEKSGATVFSGKALDEANTQIERLTSPEREYDTDTTIALAQKDGAEALEIKPGAMVMFTNKSKDAENPSRPDYWGYYNPGGKEPLMRLAAWSKTDRNGRAMLTGSVVKDEPSQALEQDQSPPDDGLDQVDELDREEELERA